MLPTLPILNINILLSLLWEEMNVGSSFLQPSPVVQWVAVLQPHTSYGTSCKLLPSNTPSKFKSPISQQHCHLFRTTHMHSYHFCTTQDNVILGRRPKYLYIMPPLRLIFPDSFAWWRDHSFVLSYVSYCMFPHSGRGYQLLQTLKNWAASTVQNITNNKIPDTFKYPQQSLASILLTAINTYKHRGSKTSRFFSDYHSIHEHSSGTIFYNLFIYISISNF